MTVAPVAGVVPTEVREAGTKAVEQYKAAQSFETMLVKQLTQSMLASSPLAQGPYADNVADAFAEGVSRSGGLGLTDQLYRSMTLGDTTP